MALDREHGGSVAGQGQFEVVAPGSERHVARPDHRAVEGPQGGHGRSRRFHIERGVQDLRRCTQAQAVAVGHSTRGDSGRSPLGGGGGQPGVVGVHARHGNQVDSHDVAGAFLGGLLVEGVHRVDLAGCGLEADPVDVEGSTERMRIGLQRKEVDVGAVGGNQSAQVQCVVGQRDRVGLPGVGGERSQRRFAPGPAFRHRDQAQGGVSVLGRAGRVVGGRSLDAGAHQHGVVGGEVPLQHAEVHLTEARVLRGVQDAHGVGPRRDRVVAGGVAGKLRESRPGAHGVEEAEVVGGPFLVAVENCHGAVALAAGVPGHGDHAPAQGRLGHVVVEVAAREDRQAQIVAGGGEPLHGPELADHHGDVLIEVLGLHEVELRIDVRLFAPGGVVRGVGGGVEPLAPVVEGRAPIGGLGHQAELVGVEVGLDHEAVGDLVGRQGGHPIRGVLEGGAGPLKDQGARGVVASRGAHGVDEDLVQTDEDGQVGAVVDSRLVGAGEHQAAPVVAEGGGDLLPVGSLLGAHGREHRRPGGGRVDLAFDPSAVPMDVQDHEQAVLDGVVHDLLHLGHPSGIDHAGGCVGVHVPGGGNAHGLEARGLHGVEQRLGGNGLHPDQLHRVAQVPAHAHLAGEGLGGGQGLRRGDGNAENHTSDGGEIREREQVSSIHVLHPNGCVAPRRVDCSNSR